MITVKAGKFPGTIAEVVLESGATVNDALEAAGITSTTGLRIEVDGNSATKETEIFEGARVLLLKQIKGNA